MAWQIIESFVEGKSPAKECEDLIVVTDDFAAVIDGATDATGAAFDGRTGGRFAAEVIGTAIEALPRDVGARVFADRLTRALLDAVQATAGDLPDDVRWPAACVVCLSAANREVWRIGDCNVVVDGVAHPGTKRVDEASYGFRAVVNAALLARGTPLEEILEHDPGAQAARPLTDIQQHLANRVGPWGYGCINGRPIPSEYVEVVPVPNAPCEVVLTSDGFAEVLPTLSASEARLDEMITADPAAVGSLWLLGKSLRPGFRSLDDRAYLRIAPA
ncbi:MAG: protein phosphatase 2C domain-containing protein [Acidimicrobiia bacterium]|nr:protein phosphatase 2C domain-containing protein [Acidimicrobiia bacterium]